MELESITSIRVQNVISAFIVWNVQGFNDIAE